MKRVRIVVDGRPFDATVETTESGTRRVTVEGHAYEVHQVDATLGVRDLTVHLEDGPHRVRLLDRDHAEIDGMRSTFHLQQVQSGAQAGVVGKEGTEVHPPMPGKVVSVRVAEGDVVEEGQILLVLEAMKMQNEVVSPATGTVRRIRVTPGTTVESRDVLIELGPPEEPSESPPARMVA